eukprot:scaffold173800_cov48-Prasinocladus_malaysianus.AAC.1
MSTSSEAQRRTAAAAGFAYRSSDEGVVQQFSLHVSKFLARLTSIAMSFGGDIDGFRGDSFLVLFETAEGPEGQARTAVQAVHCALKLWTELDQYRSTSNCPDDPPELLICNLSIAS